MLLKFFLQISQGETLQDPIQLKTSPQGYVINSIYNALKNEIFKMTVSPFKLAPKKAVPSKNFEKAGNDFNLLRASEIRITQFSPFSEWCLQC